ncbi:MAG: hypothetical protein NVS3B20_10700 [Polyangiales bacterium]
MTIAITVAALGTLAWLLGTVAVVGLNSWWQLSRAQLEGHATRWGESSARWSGASVGVRGLRGLFEAVSLQWVGSDRVPVTAVVVLFAISMIVLPRRHRKTRLAIIVSVLPYAAFVIFFQAIYAAPRHALPLAAGLAIALASGVREILRTSPKISRPCLAIALALLATSGADAARTHRQPPAAVAMLRFVAHEPACAKATVIGSRSTRFAAWGDQTRTAPGASGGDAIVFAMRADVLPRPLLVTDELDLRDIAPERLRFIAKFSRASPMDRRERSMGLYRLELKPAVSQVVP